MAENKSSILLYTDLIHTFEALSDDEAGRLIKHLFRYVNDENPEAPDKLTRIAFEPIKQQLKRDLVKWEGIKQTKSQGGKLGNIKRWHPDLYKKIMNKKLTLNEAIVIANNRTTSVSDRYPIYTDNMGSDDIANIAVNDNVTVNVIDNNIITPVVPTTGVDFEKFINGFNSCAGRNFRVTEKVKKSLIARLKEYTNVEIWAAIKNAHSDEYHVETRFRYLTPEFILRPDKLEKFLNLPAKNKQKGYTPELTN